MLHVNIFSNINSLENQKKSRPELMDLLSTMDCYNMDVRFRSINAGNKEKRDNIEHHSIYSSEFSRIVSAHPGHNIIVLCFPKVFVSGFMLPIAQYLLAKKIKFFTTGLQKNQHDKLFVKPATNILSTPTFKEHDTFYDSLQKKPVRLTGILEMLRNISWSNVLPEEVIGKFNKMVTDWIAKGYTDVQQVETTVSKDFFTNIVILNIIINRYRIPLGDVLSMLTGETTGNPKSIAKVMAFFFFNKKISELKPLFQDVFTTRDIVFENHSMVEFFMSAIRHIDQQPNSEIAYRMFTRNFIRFFYISRIQVDSDIAKYLKNLPPMDEEELQERMEVRDFISSSGMLHANTDWNKQLTSKEKKTIFIRFLNNMKKHGVTGNASVDQFIKNTDDLFFKSSVFKKITDFLKNNPAYWNTHFLKRLIPKIDFNLEEIENIFSYYRRVYVTEYAYFNKLFTTLSDSSNKIGIENLSKQFDLHQEKKLKVISEFEYIFVQEQELSYIEKFLTTLGKYQLGIKFFKEIPNSLFYKEQFDKIPSGYNKVWQYPTSKIYFDKSNTPPIISTHARFIEKTVFKCFKEISGDGINTLYGEYGKNTFNVIYEKLIDEYYCSIGYSQFFDILKCKLFMSERQLEIYGYSKMNQYPEDYIYYNDFYVGSDTKKKTDGAKYKQFAAITKNITENYGKFIDDYIESIHANFTGEDEKQPLLLIGENLKKYDRNVLTNFRKENIFHLFLHNIMKQFCVDNADLIRKRDNNIILSLNDKYYFLKYFIKNLLIEINGQVTHIHFCYNPGLTEDKINRRFIDMLESVSGKEYLLDFEKLITVYKYLFQINKYINQLQKLAGVVLVYEIIAQNYVRVLPTRQQLTGMGFSELPDEKKIIISVPENMGKINTSEIMKVPADLPKVYESFSLFNESLNIYIRISEEIEELYNFMKTFNESFALIPSIKYAPTPLKKVRLNVKNIGKILMLEFEKITLSDIDLLDRYCFEIWRDYQEIIRIESVLENKYKFWHIGYRQLTMKLGKKKMDAINMFFRNGFEHVKNKKKNSSHFSYRLKIALNARDKLFKKELFFIVPIKGLKALSIDCIKNIQIIKGLNTTIYVDRKESLTFQEDLYSFIPPNHFIDIVR